MPASAPVCWSCGRCNGRAANKPAREPLASRHPGVLILDMLIYSMGVSVDGFISNRDGEFAWTEPSEEQFRFHIAQVSELGSYLLGRRLYEDMLV
jgi:hypothetical protein